MDFSFSEEHVMLRDMIQKFTESEIKPRARDIDLNGKMPPDLIKQAAELGLFGMVFPEEYGGVGAGEIGYCIMLEEISRGCASTAVTIGAHESIGAMAIYLWGTEEQKQKYLVPLAKGEKLAAYALTEPSSGSDAASLQTTAVLKGDEYILNGAKLWITNGSIADTITVFAATDKSLGAHGGITAFIVEADSPGLKRTHMGKKLGICGSDTAELHFEEVKVPKANVLGEVGHGFALAMAALDYGRLGLGAGCLGASKEMLAKTIEFSKQRVQFGKPIAEFEAIQWMISEMAASVYAMESMVYRTAWMADAKQPFARQSAICKMMCSELADQVVDKAMQAHGGMGYMNEYPVERFYRDSRINRIFEGTNEVQRLVIARELLKKGSY